MHDIVREPTDGFQNSLFAYFEKEAKRNEDASCVFLLWGSRDSESSPTWAVDVQMARVEDEGEMFRRLAQRYLAERGFLQRYLSLRQFDKLEPVTVRSD
jgi:hypothetical protein